MAVAAQVCGLAPSERPSNLISMAARVNLADRAAAGIPPDAAYFSFAHPPMGVGAAPERVSELLAAAGKLVLDLPLIQLQPLDIQLRAPLRVLRRPQFLPRLHQLRRLPQSRRS